jgi:hypothetical protein
MTPGPAPKEIPVSKPKSPPTDPPPSRRDFARTVVALAAAPLAAAAGSAAAQGKKPAPPPDPTRAAARALAEIVRIRYGKFMTADQLKAARRRIQSGLFIAGHLHRTKLPNGAEPAFVFRADLP